jgi:hypothetical protein
MTVFFIVSIFCLALCLIMFFYLKWYIKSRVTSDVLKEHRTEVAKLIADINSVTDRNVQIIEDSISKLKKLTEETEKRIEEFKNAIEIKPSGTALYTNLGHGVRSALKAPEEQQPLPSPPPPSPQLQTEHPLNARQLSLGLQTGEIFDTPVKPERKTPQAAHAAHKPPSKKQIRNAIDSLIGEGLSAEEIANRLEISIAQVNFALNLRKTER